VERQRPYPPTSEFATEGTSCILQHQAAQCGALCERLVRDFVLEPTEVAPARAVSGGGGPSAPRRHPSGAQRRYTALLISNRAAVRLVPDSATDIDVAPPLTVTLSTPTWKKNWLSTSVIRSRTSLPASAERS
jgi:hypothetical protein